MPTTLTFSKTLFTSDRVKNIPYTVVASSEEEDYTFEAIRTYKDSEGDVRPSSAPNTAAVKKVLTGIPGLIKKAKSLVHALKDAHDIQCKVVPSATSKDES